MYANHVLCTLLYAAASAVALSPLSTGPHGTCNESTATVRKEYGALATWERLAFIDAVKCVMAKPSVLDDVPGSTNKYNDYAAVHVNLTTSIHMDGIFLSWHRHFLHLMEAELHACGYPAGLGMPYWNWTMYAGLEASPLFDGSATSLGGNGDWDPDAAAGTLPGGATVPRGTGGGCVTTGPFANLSVSLGPFAFALVFAGAAPAGWAAANPRCLTRDLNDWAVAAYLRPADVGAELAYDTVGDFQYYVNAVGNSAGLHGGGHLAIGGVAFDFFASPQDPAFWLHHAMLDQVWAIWQAADPQTRRYAWNGTSSIFNTNTTAPVYNGTTLDFGILAESVTVHEVADPWGGPYCYKYI